VPGQGNDERTDEKRRTNGPAQFLIFP